MRIKDSYLLRWVFLTLTIMIGKPGRSEIVHGFVADKDTHECLSEVLLIVEHQMEVNGLIGKGQMCIYTDSVGHYKFLSGSAGTISAQLIGYKPQSMVYMAFSNTAKDSVEVDTIFLEPSEIMLKAIEVKARAKRFTIKGDTIVFNPEAFHLKAGTRLEDLILQLPGVEMNDGQLIWNGKTIRLMINGEDLFGASNVVGQLPIEAAESIKAYNKASEFSERTGKDDGQEDMVLDVNIKKNWLDKWYGRAEAQYQTSSHYGGDILANRLSDTAPAMITASANDLRQLNRRKLGESKQSIGGGFGREQYGAAGYQNNWKKTVGEQTMKSSWSVLGGMAHDDLWQTRFLDTEAFFPNAIPTYTTTSSYNRTHTLDPSAEANMRWAIDNKNTIRTIVNVEYKQTHGKNEYKRAQFDGNPYSLYGNPLQQVFENQAVTSLLLLNRNLSTSETKLNKVDIEAEWTHYIAKGSLSFSSSFNYIGNKDRLRMERKIEYPNSQLALSVINQAAHTTKKSFQLTSQFRFNRWICDNVLINVNYRFFHNQSSASNYATIDDQYDATNSYEEDYNKNDHTITSNLTINLRSFQLLPQIAWTLRHEQEQYDRGSIDTLASRNINIFTSQLKAVYRLSNSSKFEMNIGYNEGLPNLLRTIAYHDDSDPLFVREGNIGLKRSRLYNISMNYSLAQASHQRTVLASANFQSKDREWQDMLIYTPQTGAYLCRPENIKGSIQASTRLNIIQNLGSKWRMNNNVELKYGLRHAYLTSDVVGTLPSINHQHYYISTEKCTISYEHNWLKLSAFAQIQMHRQLMSAALLDNTTLWNNQFGFTADITIGAFSIQTRLTENLRRGYVAPSMNRNFLIWNTNLYYSFLKEKASLSLTFNDILNQFDNFSSQQTAYQNTYSWSEVMHHYAKLTFTYTLDARQKK